MRFHFFFSLCVMTPLLLKADETASKMFEDIDLLIYENLESSEDDQDFIDSIVLETFEEEKNARDEPESIALEKSDSSHVPMQQELQGNLADIQTPQRFPEASNDTMCTDPTMCMPDIESFQANVRHTESKGIGYKKGYTTLEGLFTFSRSKYIPFLDLRGHVFDNGRLAANVGIGTRYLINPSKSMIGINTYYDYRNLKHAHFNQWGVGVEGFYKRWELRINGYLPVGSKKIVTDHDLNWISFKKFQNNNIWINENYTDKILSAKKGFNLEAAVHPFKIMRDYDCIVAAGPYYFGGEGKSTWGVKVRIKTEIAKYVFVELSDSYDHIFHNRFQGTVMLSLPFGGKKCYPKRTPSTGDCFADNIMVWRGVQPVERQEIIVTNKQTKTYTVDPIAIDSITKEPIRITFVNNQAVLEGDGTFENPFSTLANAQANTTVGDNIYIFAGDGTSTGYDSGWILQDGQRFLGSAAAHNFQTTKGVVTVPLQTDIFPLITATGITTPIKSNGMTNFNEVAGVSVQQTSASVGVSIDSQNMIVQNNIILGFANTNQAGILATSMGDALITNNIFFGNGNTLNGGLLFSTGMTQAGEIVNAVISNNVFTNSASGMTIVSNLGAAGVCNLTVTGNVVSDTSAGNGINILVVNGTLTMRATINSNTVFNTASSGIFIRQLTPGTGYYQLFDNTIFNTAGVNGNVLFTAGTAGQNLCVNVHDNQSVLNTAGGSGYNFTTSGGSIFTEPFVNNIGTISGTFTPVPPCFCQFCTLPE